MEKSGSPRTSDQRPGQARSPEETILLRIAGKVPKHIDEIAQEAEITARRAAAMLLELEFRGLVSQLPGKYFIS
jgi:DNA processing protein